MAKEKWVEIRKGADFEAIGEKYGISPLLARLIINRGVSEEDINIYLRGTLEDMYDPHLLKDMDKACDIIAECLLAKRKIRIIGDYDVDGVCSSYILEKTFKNCFYDMHKEAPEEYIDTVIPHRIHDGYGINIRLIDEAIKDGVELIVTCDNGISAKAEIEYGCKNGIDFIVTDHHEVPYREENDQKIYELPAALAIVNPKQKDCEYPFENICGAQVAFKLSQVMYTRYTKRDIYEFLDMAALAAIEDVMPLCDENRILVRYGLERIRDTENLGLRALLAVTEMEDRDLSAYNIGFVIGPCLNAAGRLESAELAKSLLMAKSDAEAMKIALRLKELNDERKGETEKGVQTAEEYINSMDKIPDVLVVYLPECHESIAGIVAGRVREKYNHPAIVLTKTEDGVKGSGRSIDEYDMHAALIRCKELFSKFGGHKLAAGLSMNALTDEEREAAVKRLSDTLNEQSELKEDDFSVKIAIDMAPPFEYLNEDLVEELKLIEPCGMGNKRPLLGAAGIQVVNGRLLGKNEDTYKAIARDKNGRMIDMIIFKTNVETLEYMQQHETVAITYTLDMNEFRGVRSLQLQVKNFK